MNVSLDGGFSGCPAQMAHHPPARDTAPTVYTTINHRTLFRGAKEKTEAVAIHTARQLSGEIF